MTRARAYALAGAAAVAATVLNACDSDDEPAAPTADRLGHHVSPELPDPSTVTDAPGEQEIAEALTIGAPGESHALVLYDTTGDYSWMGEVYALGAAQLASHFGEATVMAAVDYEAGLIEDFDALIYLGSSYDEPLPESMIDDVTGTAVHVIWAGFNAWQLSGEVGTDQHQAFLDRYGWDPSTSYANDVDDLVGVDYKDQRLTRYPSRIGVIAPHIAAGETGERVEVLATVECSADGEPVDCAPVAQSDGSRMPWAVRSANLTYLGEVPFSYIDETDRYLVFADLLYPALGPDREPVRQAMLRLEDVSALSDPDSLREYADYLSSRDVPFQVAVIPIYADPLGRVTGTEGTEIALTDAPEVVAALEYLQERGGTLIQHGTTHQYDSEPNPYDGATGADFEFYASACSADREGEQLEECTPASWVQLTGPVSRDQVADHVERIERGRAVMEEAGLGTPTIFETPHYTGSHNAYTAMAQLYDTRYERGLYFGGSLRGDGEIDTDRVFGQFFPYSVIDVHGTRVLPENLGNYSAEDFNNHPARHPDFLIEAARANLVVTESTASFFYHPYFEVDHLAEIVEGITELGYTFVSADDFE